MTINSNNHKRIDLNHLQNKDEDFCIVSYCAQTEYLTKQTYQQFGKSKSKKKFLLSLRYFIHHNIPYECQVHMGRKSFLKSKIPIESLAASIEIINESDLFMSLTPGNKLLMSLLLGKYNKCR